MWRVVVIMTGFVTGGILGFRSLLPPTPSADEYECGLAVLSAIFFGFPAGMILGGLVGFILIRAIENEARPSSGRHRSGCDEDDKRPGRSPRRLWDHDLDG
jgi:hypothetical protein